MFRVAGSGVYGLGFRRFDRGKQWRASIEVRDGGLVLSS